MNLTDKYLRDNALQLVILLAQSLRLGLMINMVSKDFSPILLNINRTVVIKNVIL